IADYGFKKIEHRIFNNAGIGELQKSLVDFAHRMQSQLVKVDLYFGIAFLVLALVILIYIYKTRGRTKQPRLASSPEDAAPEASPTDASNVRLAPRRNQQPALDVMAPKSKPTGPPTLPKSSTPASK